VTSEFVSELSVNVRKTRSIGECCVYCDVVVITLSSISLGRGGLFVLLETPDAVKRALDGATRLGDGKWRVELPNAAPVPRSDRVSNK
jgi:hypothetical protein